MLNCEGTTTYRNVTKMWKTLTINKSPQTNLMISPTTNIYEISEIEMSYKKKYKASQRPKITTSIECYQILFGYWNKEILGFIEEFKILLLNRANRVIGIFPVSTGGMCGTIADPRVIFVAALKACATSIILAHNHPSGNLQPSQSDIDLTNKLKAAGKLLDIEVLDHIILAEDTYLSFADEGIM